MPFIILVGLFITAMLCSVIYCCFKYGFRQTRRMFGALASRISIAVPAFFMLLFSAMYCYGYLAQILKDALISGGAANQLRDTVRLICGTTSVLAYVQTLFISCVMAGVFSCVTFIVRRVRRYKLSASNVGLNTVFRSIKNQTDCQAVADEDKTFLAFAKFIS